MIFGFLVFSTHGMGVGMDRLFFFLMLRGMSDCWLVWWWGSNVGLLGYLSIVLCVNGFFEVLISGLVWAWFILFNLIFILLLCADSSLISLPFVWLCCWC